MSLPPKPRRPLHRLAPRVVALMVLASFVLSIVAAAVQLYISYQRDLSQTVDRFTQIEAGFEAALEQALWRGDMDQAALLVNGIQASPGVSTTRLSVTRGPVIARAGQAGADPAANRTYPLIFNAPGRPPQFVGTLEISLSFDEARQSLWQQFITLALTNLAKATVASVVMALILERSVARHLRTIAAHFQRPEGDLVLDRAVAQDEFDQITQSFNATHRSREAARAQLSAVLDAATCGVIAVDAAGRITMANKTARQILGVQSQPTPFVWPKDIVLRPMEAEGRDGVLDPLDWLLAGQNVTCRLQQVQAHPPALSARSERIVTLSSAPLRTPTQDVHTVVILDDITKAHHDRRLLDRENRLEALGQLTGGIAHDFNNILAAALSALELGQAAHGADAGARHLSAAQQSILRGRALTDRLLGFAKRQPENTQDAAMHQVFADFDRLVTPLLPPSVRLEIAPPPPDLWVHCDPGQLETALMNLILNSRDALVGAGRAGRITLACRPAGDTFDLRVTDDGPGMTPDQIARATDPFYTTKGAQHGTGLGLSLVYGFARQSGGDMRLHSSPGAGTTVTLTLPRGTAQPAADPPQRPTDLPKGQGQVILVVEDTEDLRVLLCEALARLGYDTLPASQGPAALALVRGRPEIALVLSDVAMPGGMTGFELGRAARALRPTLPVIYMSGFAGQDAPSPGDIVLRKPTPLAVLARAVADALHAPAPD